MKLIDTKTGLEIEAIILKVEEKDYYHIKESKNFEFNWSQEKTNHVYKILRKSDLKDNPVWGLMSIVDRADEMRIHINLIESSNNNKGAKKEVNNIAGCLLAFATKIAFEKGYYGFTSLVPKTQLIRLYVEKYGFSQYGKQLAIEGQAAIDLIEKYL